MGDDTASRRSLTVAVRIHDDGAPELAVLVPRRFGRGLVLHGRVALGTRQVYRRQEDETVPLGPGAGVHRGRRTLMVSGRRLVHVSILAGGEL